MSAHATPEPMTARKSGPLRGVAEVPGDKSISHRSLIFGAMAVGETKITGLLEGQDVLDTAAAMRAFGADVVQHGPGAWSVHGVGVGGFSEPADVIDCGNSGTGVRLIMGCMATTPIVATFTGDASLRKRPMGRVTEPLSLFGTQAYGRKGGRLPMTVVGAAQPVPVRYALPVASAQVKSAVLLAGLNAPGETVVIEREPTRDHSERMLLGFGAQLSVEKTAEGHGENDSQVCAVRKPRGDEVWRSVGWRTRCAERKNLFGGAMENKVPEKSACGLPSNVVIAMAGRAVQFSDGEWRARLTPEQYRVTRQQGTEPPFRNAYWDHHEDGVYFSVCSETPLFDSRDKFESGTGWPSFTRPIEPKFVAAQVDESHGMRRIEVHCAVDGAHLGHVFEDGPKPTGL
ncbi:MAG: peptide-methionine (R)-S-oxide reductase MsrB, partial [Rhodobacteraceae bacterium]|nr:peptide-methionine (R)-S-oxide reductase MsrB [Paracoccaceae bacterium]